MMRMSDNPFPLIDDGWMDNKKSLWSPLTPFLFPLPLPEGVRGFMLEGDFPQNASFIMLAQLTGFGF